MAYERRDTNTPAYKRAREKFNSNPDNQERSRISSKASKDRNREAIRAAGRVHVQRIHAEQPARYLRMACVSSAKKQGLSCTMSVADFEELLASGVCALTGIEWRWEPEIKRDDLAPSPDRIDQTKGYDPGNVRIVLWVVNKMRNDLSDIGLYYLARRMLENVP